MSAATVVMMPLREADPNGRAQSQDIFSAPGVTSTESHVWCILCSYRNASNRAFPGIARLAKDCRKGVRAAQRALRGLEEKGWIGRPEGCSGGNPLDSHTVYHLHRDGKPCQECVTGQQRRSRQTDARRVSPTTPVKASPVPPRGVSFQTERGVISDSAYKEEYLIEPLDPLTPAEQAIAPETSETLVSASIPLCGEKFSQASNQKNSSSQTTAVETITNHPTPQDPPPPLPSAALPEAVQACAAKIYQNHPPQRKDISLAKVGRRITEILRYRKLAGEPALAYLGVLADRHGAWCRYGEWKKENGRFAKGLNRWLAPGEELYEIDSPEQAIPATPEPRGLQIWEIK